MTTPVLANGGLAVLTGNLAPDGAVIKPGAMEQHLLVHRGRAVVFDDYDDLCRAHRRSGARRRTRFGARAAQRRTDRRTRFSRMGQLPIPKKMLAQGVRDMVRISDARMSGTSYGACVLHVAPESAVGGPLALVRTGDEIELDVPRRTLNLLVDADELARRRQGWRTPPPHYERGYGALFSRHITQANDGCDFDFLEGTSPIPEPQIH